MNLEDFNNIQRDFQADVEIECTNDILEQDTFKQILITAVENKTMVKLRILSSTYYDLFKRTIHEVEKKLKGGAPLKGVLTIEYVPVEEGR
jgi:hypothetical protein